MIWNNHSSYIKTNLKDKVLELLFSSINCELNVALIFYFVLSIISGLYFQRIEFCQNKVDLYLKEVDLEVNLVFNKAQECPQKRQDSNTWSDHASSFQAREQKWGYLYCQKWAWTIFFTCSQIPFFNVATTYMFYKQQNKENYQSTNFPNTVGERIR